MYEESLRTPLIVRWPGVVKPASSNTDLVMNLDMAAVTVPFGSFTGCVNTEDWSARSYP